MLPILAFRIFQQPVLAVAEQENVSLDARDEVQPALISAGKALADAAGFGFLYFHALNGEDLYAVLADDHGVFVVRGGLFVVRHRSPAVGKDVDVTVAR